MSERGKHGNHFKGQRAPRITIECERCGKKKEYLACFLKVHPIRYCSRQCHAASIENKALIKCSVCDTEFKRRRDQVKIKNYCSKACSSKGRTVEGAKWRDPEQIKNYMKEYLNSNRDARNKASRDWVKNNKYKRVVIRAASRSSIKFNLGKGDLTVEQWENMVKRFNHSCVCCGKSEPDIVLTIDHIIPQSKGGLNTESNIQPLCISCNSRKNNKAIDYRNSLKPNNAPAPQESDTTM